MAKLQIQTFDYTILFDKFDALVNDFLKTVPILNIHKTEWHEKIFWITYEIEDPLK